MKQVTYVFGHRNPDTDSVCSAISLSYLKNQRGENTSPRVLGHINKETQFVLNYFGVKEPEYLNNVKVQLRDVMYNKGVMLNYHASIKQVFDFMQEHSCTAVPIIDDKKKLKGLITLKEIATMFVESSKNYLNTSYNHIVEALKGKEILRFHEEFHGNLLAGSYKSQTFIETAVLNPNDILIVGDRNKVIRHGIESKIALIVITNNLPMDEKLLELAKENHVSVISSSYDTFNTCNKIALSNFVDTVKMNTSPSFVHELDYLTDFVAYATRQGYTNYPILNKRGDCLGLIRITDVAKYHKKKVVLVDNNEAMRESIKKQITNDKIEIVIIRKVL